MGVQGFSVFKCSEGDSNDLPDASSELASSSSQVVDKDGPSTFNGLIAPKINEHSS